MLVFLRPTRSLPIILLSPFSLIKDSEFSAMAESRGPVTCTLPLSPVTRRHSMSNPRVDVNSWRSIYYPYNNFYPLSDVSLTRHRWITNIDFRPYSIGESCNEAPFYLRPRWPNSA
ncbi:unnamed protein product [Musa textilis]